MTISMIGNNSDTDIWYYTVGEIGKDSFNYEALVDMAFPCYCHCNTYVFGIWNMAVSEDFKNLEPFNIESTNFD